MRGATTRDEHAIEQTNAAPITQMTWRAQLPRHRPGSTFLRVFHVEDDRLRFVLRAIVATCGVLRNGRRRPRRHHAKRFGYPQGACSGALVTALDTFVTSTPICTLSTEQRLQSGVRTFIDFCEESGRGLTFPVLFSELLEIRKVLSTFIRLSIVSTMRYPRAPERRAEPLPSVWLLTLERESR